MLGFLALLFLHQVNEVLAAADVDSLLESLDLHLLSSFSLLSMNLVMSFADVVFGHFIFLTVLNEIKEVLPALNWSVISLIALAISPIWDLVEGKARLLDGLQVLSLGAVGLDSDLQIFFELQFDFLLFVCAS